MTHDPHTGQQIRALRRLPRYHAIEPPPLPESRWWEIATTAGLIVFWAILIAAPFLASEIK